MDLLQQYAPQLLGIFLGIGLAASAGFRVFVPLFMLSIGVNLGFVPINEEWAWVGEKTALITLGVATFFEIFAYYIPFLDNLLDTIAIPMATLAGTLAMGATITDLSPAITWPLAIIAGGGTAIAVKSTAATTRMASTATTAGTGNFIVSTFETGISTFLGVLALISPILVFIAVLLLFFLLYKVYRFYKNKKRHLKSVNT